MKRILPALIGLLLLLPLCPASAQEHYFLARKEQGQSVRLVGNVKILTVFVSTESHPWTEEAKDKYYGDMREAVRLLNDAAAAQGVGLSVSSAHFDVETPYEDDWYTWILESFFAVEDMDELQQIYEESLGVDETPFIFAFNDNDRSYSYSANPLINSTTQEYTVINANKSGVSRTIAHELLHQFGAVDYYFPPFVKETAKRDFSDSIMNTKGTAFDPFTAYMIGWRDDLTPSAKRFVDETSFITADYMSEALDVEWPDHK